MKKTIPSLFFACLAWAASAQQGAVYNLYFHDHYYLNPAAAGLSGPTSFYINAKEFWLGFPENTPGTQSLVFHTRLKKMSLSKRKRSFGQRRPGSVGVGAMLYNDYNGPIRKTGLLTSYAYHIYMNDVHMSFGLSSFTYQFITDKQQINLKNKNDRFYSEGGHFYATDANIGFYLKANGYHLSIATLNLLQSSVKLVDSDFIDYKENRLYSLFTGYNLELNKRLFVEPSLYFQTDEALSMRMELNVRLLYSEKVWGGFGLSSLNTLCAFTGYTSDQFDFGYSFQLPNSDVIEYSFGSHEIQFGIKFGQAADNKRNGYRGRRR
jgi:type IX secretion system PorP/SprF family membrane protein